MIRQSGQLQRGSSSTRHVKGALRLMGEAGLFDRAAASDSRDWREYSSAKRSIPRRVWIAIMIVVATGIVVWLGIH